MTEISEKIFSKSHMPYDNNFPFFSRVITVNWQPSDGEFHVKCAKYKKKQKSPNQGKNYKTLNEDLSKFILSVRHETFNLPELEHIQYLRW